ncbi:TPA: DUF2523 family protein [Vibrio harveyi]
MMEFFDYMANVGATVLDYMNNLDSMFDQFFVWLQVWWIKARLSASLYFVKISFLVAKSLLEEIGFASLFVELFNKLPSELRYWFNLYKVPQGFSIYANCATTAIVMRMSR